MIQIQPISLKEMLKSMLKRKINNKIINGEGGSIIHLINQLFSLSKAGLKSWEKTISRIPKMQASKYIMI